MKRLLFHRDFLGYTGGHGKVRDYFDHAAAHPAWSPRMYLTPRSVAQGNPWAALPATEARWDPARADALFLAGFDWQALPEQATTPPIINLVQHVRHGDRGHPLSRFLDRRAIRICVSQPVADAILATGRVRGPVHVIPAGLSLPSCRPHDVLRQRAVFIDAIKQPELGAAVADRLRRHGVEDIALSSTRMARDDYLAALENASVVVALPHATEGFYLPALEAMALGSAVVVPDCVGNRDYLEPDTNALVPALEPDALAGAALRVLNNPGTRAALVAEGLHTARRFTLQGERAAFHALLDRIDAMWVDA